MESTIIEEIIYRGCLARAGTDIHSERRGVRTVRSATSSTGTELKKTWRGLVQTLSTSEGQAKERMKGVKFPQEKFTAETMLFRIEKQQPANIFENQMFHLLELETYRLMGLVTENVRTAGCNDDRFYIVTLAMRKWSDYLVDLQKSTSLQTDNGSNAETLQEELRKRLMVLICDLSERYSDLDLMECFDHEEIYPLLLNRKAPDKPEILPTAALIEKKGAEMALILLKKGPDETDFLIFLDELKGFVGETLNREHPLTAVIEKSVHHLENLLLLYFWQEPSFLEENRKILTNPETATEWVQGVREEALEKMNRKMEETLKKCWSIKKQAEPYIAVAENIIPEKGKKSEAHRFLEELEEMDRAFFQEPYSAEKEKGETTKDDHSNPFLDQAGEKFISKEHLYEYFNFSNPNSRSTRTNFLKKAGFRYVEVTDQKHLVYITDVEEFIEKNTKRYGEDG